MKPSQLYLLYFPLLSSRPELRMLDLGEWFYIFKPQIHKYSSHLLTLTRNSQEQSSVKTCITSFRPSPIPNLEILKDIHWLDVGG